MPSVGAVFVTFTKQRSIKYQFNTSQYKVNQYVLHEFDNTRGVIISVRYIKDPYAHIDVDNTINISKEDK